jgi:hypothetical protein
MPVVRLLASAVVVAAFGTVITGCNSDGAQAQDRACKGAVESLSDALASTTTLSAHDRSLATGVVTTCPSRPSWRDAAMRSDIATKIGRLHGADRSKMRGTSVTALDYAFNYLCANFQPPGGTRACSDTNS